MVLPVNPLNCAVNAAHNQVHLGSRSACSGFLFGSLLSNLAVALEPGIELLKLVCR